MNGPVFRLRRRWHRLMCRANRHDMMLYYVGQNYFRQCFWCCKVGLLSELDRDLISNGHHMGHISAPINEEDDSSPA